MAEGEKIGKLHNLQVAHRQVSEKKCQKHDSEAYPEFRDLPGPVAQWMHDYMHCLLSNGLLAYALLFSEALSCWQSFFCYTKFLEDA